MSQPAAPCCAGLPEVGAAAGAEAAVGCPGEDKPTRLSEMLAHNETFTRTDFRALPTAPRKVVILTCMDPRLNTLLPKALGLKEGEAYVIKNAGAIITHPFGGITRSVLVAIYELGAKEVFVIGHRSVAAPSSALRMLAGHPGASPTHSRTHAHAPTRPPPLPH
jgi:carbonic anhydrase